ncbi:hypothetical protein HDK90DRAFT_549040 [Phyllosticta capitalensis]|uniref:Uncharacterized protein n=1 Tax=Phyllosticta capitalensis TaxID=121624 RepID=A0ABR1YX01_9PEZI
MIPRPLIPRPYLSPLSIHPCVARPVACQITRPTLLQAHYSSQKPPPPPRNERPCNAKSSAKAIHESLAAANEKMKRATRDRRLDALGDAVVAFAGSLARRADARAWRRAQGPARRELERMQWQARRQREVQETRRLFDECERDETIPPLLRCAVRALRRVADDMGYLGRRPSVLGLTCRFIVIGGAWMVVFGLLGRLGL